MPIVRHPDPDAFLAASAAALAHDAAAASIVRSVALGVKRRPPARGERVYLATWHDGARAAAAVQRADNPLLVGASEPALAAHFADDLAGEHPALHGVGGALAACEAFARRWRTRTRRAHVLRAHLRHHVLTEVASLPAVRGAMRPARDGDVEWLVDASLAFVAEAGVPEAPAQVRRHVPLGHAQGRYRIWEDKGRAAFAGWSDAGTGDARVGPVYTPPARRRRGYATALVAALSRELLAAGHARLFLSADIANPTACAVYERIGYRAVSDYFHFDFVRVPRGQTAA